MTTYLDGYTLSDGSWILLSTGLILMFWAIGANQRLKALRKQVQRAFEQLIDQARQTHEVMPDLIKMARLFMKHEIDTHESLQQAYDEVVQLIPLAQRQSFTTPVLEQLNLAEAHLMHAIAKLLALSEAYPDMKANAAFITLRGELGLATSKQAYARQVFNEQAEVYNQAIAQFPTLVLAALLRYRPAVILEETLSQQISLSQHSILDTSSL